MFNKFASEIRFELLYGILLNRKIWTGPADDRDNELYTLSSICTTHLRCLSYHNTEFRVQFGSIKHYDNIFYIDGKFWNELLWMKVLSCF